MTPQLDAYRAWLKRAKRTQLVAFNCPACAKAVQSPRPPVGQTFDSLASCPYCDATFFKIVEGNGEVTATLLSQAVPYQARAA